MYSSLQLNLEKDKNYKHLRKSFATLATKVMGSTAGAAAITDHDNLRVLETHYQDKEEILKHASKNMKFLDES